MADWLSAPSLVAASSAVLGVCVLAGLLVSAPRLAGAFRGTRLPAILAMVVMAGLHLCLVKPRLPHTIWHEHRAGSYLESVLSGPWQQAGVTLHGPAFPLAMRALRGVLSSEMCVFSWNYALSVSSACVLFLLLRLLAGKASPGLIGAAMLLSLPAHNRLSTTETEFILLEFLSLACFLFFCLWRRTRDRRFLGLGLGCVALVMQTRAEMMALAPAVLLVYLAVLRRDLPAGFLRSRGVWAAAALAAALCVPRAVQVLAWGGERTADVLTNPFEFFGPGWRTLNVFLDTGFTPVAYIGLAVLGMSFLVLQSRALSLATAFHLYFLSQYYYRHLDCLSLKVRTGLATQYVFVGLAAFGAWRLVGGLPKRWINASYAGLAVLILASPLPYRAFLTKLYVSQQEFGFLQRAAPSLPDDAVVAQLSTEEVWSLAPVFGPTTDHEKLIRLTAGKPVRVMDVSDFLAKAKGAGGAVEAGGAARGDAALYFYRGVNCFKEDGAEHPLCLAMGSRFKLAPAGPGTSAQALVKGESLSPESMPAAGGVIGFFEVRGAVLDAPPREEDLAVEAREKEAALVKPDSWAVGAGVGWARLLARSGSEVLAKKLLNPLARSGRTQGDLAAMGRLCLELGEPRRAADFLVRAASMRPEQAGLWLMAAQASFQAGDKAAALAAVASCRASELDAEAEARLAVLLQDLGERRRALEVMDRLVRGNPRRARFLCDRGVLNALLGRRDQGWKDAMAATSADPGYLPGYLALGALADTPERRSQALRVMGRALEPKAGLREPAFLKALRSEAARLAPARRSGRGRPSPGSSRP
ncbi:MAG: glycosyltransferase family 39 protein [Elusimicrobia bacterium]|nr:glycosyltransferase family 39 protein [Elusimicrobiota bacterium]